MSNIKDVAAAAGVSISTVSRILNFDPTLNVTDQTRQRVNDEAKRLNYTKRKTKTKNTYTPRKIGIVQWYSVERELEDPFYLSIRIGAETYLNKNNIEIVRSFKGDNDYLSKLSQVEGLICIGKFSKHDVSEFRKLTDRVIFVDMFLDKIFTNSIVLDFEHAIQDAMNHLIALNHKKIGFLGGIEYTSDETEYFDRRRHFFEKFCATHQIDYKPYTVFGSYTSESGYQMMKELILKKHLPTAIFCCNDEIAIGAIRALHEYNIKIPEDISVVGFNNT
ncbi:MAG: LacI family DNA-binding transcriptional regulator, partial [Erysipelotrichaceae bacterium]